GTKVQYADGAMRFAGATYDPTSHYRADAVFEFHSAAGLTPEFLREVSRHQVGLLKKSVEAMDLAPTIAHIEPIPDDRRAGFLAIRSPRAPGICEALRARDVLTDFRSDVLRLGPAPYLSDRQLLEAALALQDVLMRVTREIGG